MAKRKKERRRKNEPAPPAPASPPRRGLKTILAWAGLLLMLALVLGVLEGVKQALLKR